MSKIIYQRDLSTGTIYTCGRLLSNCEKLTQAEGKRLCLEQSKQTLLGWIKPQQKIFTAIKHVSSSGMSRRISCYIIQGDNIKCIDRWVSEVIGWKHSDNGGIVVSGCGMDMAFHLVYTLSSILFNDGYALAKEHI